MFFYNFDSLDNFINEDLISIVKSEENKLTKIIELYNMKKKAISNEFTNIDTVIDLANNLKSELENIINLYSKSPENNVQEIKASLIKYNKKEERLFNEILDFEKSVETNRISKIDIDKNPNDNSILIISEKDQMAYLPFFYNDVKNTYEKNKDKYANMQDVINTEYTTPLSRFKNSSISRFRESFKLIRDKENGSITKALDLGLELMFKYELNPIIISACRNLDELDIYLDCLDSNDLDDFKCFDIYISYLLLDIVLVLILLFFSYNLTLILQVLY